MRGLAGPGFVGSLGCGAIKKAPVPCNMGQEPNSCDTTQIDVKKRPLASCAITHARWITGGGPSASTKFPVQAALGSPFKQPRPALIPPSRALCWFAVLSTPLPHRFNWLNCCSYYSTLSPSVKPLRKNSFPPPAGKSPDDASPFLCYNNTVTPQKYCETLRNIAKKEEKTWNPS